MNLKLVRSYCLNQINGLLTLAFYTFLISCNQKQPGLIYILEWTSSAEWVYLYLEMGQEAFITRNCLFQNCFLTNDQLYFDNVLDFDVLLFNVVHMSHEDLDPPLIRSDSQLYVLVGLEPALYHYLPPNVSNIFNMTWSYKLTADIVFPYLVVRHKRGKVLGPKKNMDWEYNVKDMAPTANDIILKLKNKSIAAAIIISNCEDLSGRQKFIRSLSQELLQYGQQVHVYGNCEFATSKCNRIPNQKNGLITSCAQKIETDYYFYLAFENSLSEDYVSEKVLHGLNHFAVPVVYGGANYTSFMPDGIYLNARTLGIERLAKEMNSIIQDSQIYFDFFKWHGYYSYCDTYELECLDTYHICNVCATLNKRIQSKRVTKYRNITNWWNNSALKDVVSHFYNILFDKKEKHLYVTAK